MNALVQTQINSWTVHDVHFLNQLPSLLEVLKVHGQEMQQQWLALQIMQSVRNPESEQQPEEKLYSRPQLQTVQQKHRNRLQYYQHLQRQVAQWQQQVSFSYQHAHCEFIDEALHEIIHLCEKIVHKMDQLLQRPTQESKQEKKSDDYRFIPQ